MKKKQVRLFFLDQKKMKKLISKIIVLIIILLCIFSLLFCYYLKIKKRYISYTEDGEINYKVYLLENDFFNEEYIINENEYIAALINYINTEFKYKISVKEEKVNYRYRCRVEAIVDVKEKNSDNILYNYEEELLLGEIKESYKKNVNIDEIIKIDYDKYNQIAKSFVKLYELDNSNSTLTINYYVQLEGSSDVFEKDVSNETVYSLCMPLNVKTVDIDETSDVSEKKQIVCKNDIDNAWWLLVISAILFVIEIKLFVDLIKFIAKNRTAESIYNRELKKILNNYGSYIQKVNNEFDVSNYTALEVDTFNDLLEIRETIQEPIIMLENENKDEAYFMIMGKMNIIYIYYIKVSDIKIKKVKDLI